VHPYIGDGTLRRCIGRTLTAFLVHTSKNLLIDLARERHGVREISFNERLLSIYAPSPESEIDVTQQLRAISLLLVTKYDKQTRDIYFAHMAGWQYSEILAHFKVSASTIYRCIARAIKIIPDDAK
jgi:DNA-directed RNA polymerase specialized sigma24 family protein